MGQVKISFMSLIILLLSFKEKKVILKDIATGFAQFSAFTTPTL